MASKQPRIPFWTRNDVLFFGIGYLVLTTNSVWGYLRGILSAQRIGFDWAIYSAIVLIYLLVRWCYRLIRHYQTPLGSDEKDEQDGSN